MRRSPLVPLVHVAVGLLIAGTLFLCGNRIAGLAVAAIASLLLVLAFAAPHTHARILGAFAACGRGVSTALTWTLMPLLFYLCFTPLRLLLRLAGKDILDRKPRGKDESYWRPHVQHHTDYRRQF